MLKRRYCSILLILFANSASAQQPSIVNVTVPVNIRCEVITSEAVPVPVPTPVPTPSPVPTPTPTPTPDPVPVPTPTPAPDPAPAPSPDPVPTDPAPVDINTPSWGSRDASGRLVVDGGEGYGLITFNGSELKNANRVGNYGLAKAPNCDTLNSVIWNSRLDQYNPDAPKEVDILHVNTNHNVKFLLLRDFFSGNSWSCEGGAWTGPAGQVCQAGVKWQKHTDPLQLLGAPEDGGFVVLQNGSLMNADQQLGIWQNPDKLRGPAAGSANGTCADPNGGKGGMVWQGVKFGNTASYEADCLARGGPQFACQSGNQFVLKADGPADGNFGEFWLIGSENISGAAIRVHGKLRELIVIGGKGGRNGWPGPIGPGKTAGPGAAFCPNGKISSSENVYSTDGTGDVYCYQSIEDAKAAGRRLPPFVHLSKAGWRNPPAGAK